MDVEGFKLKQTRTHPEESDDLLVEFAVTKQRMRAFNAQKPFPAFEAERMSKLEQSVLKRMEEHGNVLREERLQWANELPVVREGE